MDVMTSTNGTSNEHHAIDKLDSPKSNPQSTDGDEVDDEAKRRDRNAVLQALQKNPSLVGSRKDDANFFDSFYLFSVSPETLLAYFTECELQCKDLGGKARWLDPFTIRLSDCLGEYPINPDDAIKKRIQNQIASLCFPMGMKIRMIPRVALDRAKSLGWLGKEGDIAEYKELGDYGNCVIVTIREELPCTRSSFGLIACLERIREKQYAACTISRFWRKYCPSSQCRKISHHVTNPVVSRFMLSPDTPIERRRSNSPFGKKRNLPRNSGLGSGSNHSDPHHRSWSDSQQRGWDPELSARKIWSNIRRSSKKDPQSDVSKENKKDDNDGGFFGWGSSNDDNGLSDKSIYSMPLKEKARKSFSAMLANQRNGETCIVEKCYVLVNASREASDALLSSLQRLADLERNETQTTIMLEGLEPCLEVPIQPDSKEDLFIDKMGLSFPSIASMDTDNLESMPKRRSSTAKGKPRNTAEVDSITSSRLSRKSKRSKATTKLKNRGRKAIFGHSSIRIDYMPKLVPKSDSIRDLIDRAIRKNVLFQSCTDDELNNLVDVFEKADARAGKVILKQGEPGTTCYVLERGTIDVYLKDQHVKVLHSGTAFGELALLYGSPRTATLRARYDCKLWVIDQKAFHFITTQKKRERLELIVQFLRKVKIDDKFFGDILKPSEIQTIATASKSITYKPGQSIITKGERGDTFYLIESGKVHVFVDQDCQKVVTTLTDGDFFGERSLVNDTLRTATCVAVSVTTCMFIGREDFNLSLGNLKDFLSTRDRRHSLYNDNFHLVPEVESQRFDIADIEIKSSLGTGTFGNVQLVSYKKETPGVPADTLFALKCMSKKSIKEQQLSHRVEIEGVLLREVENPFIVKFYGSSEDKDNIYFLLETLIGGDLYLLLQSNGGFSEEWSRFYSGSVLYAFCHMHAKHIAYRDLKPENLSIDEKGYIRIIDLGLAKKIPGGKTWTLCGTPDYMAPEIILNQGHDWAVDYWALGILLYEMVDGSPPFYSENQMKTYQMILSGNIAMPSHFSKDLGDLIRKLLILSQEKRFGRTRGGPGAIMQHKWFDKIDWDALLEKEVEAPHAPRKKFGLAGLDDSSTEEEEEVSDSESSMSDITIEQELAEGDDVIKDLNISHSSLGEGKVSYAIGQGSRHQQKMIDMIGSSRNKKPDRRLFMRSINQTSVNGKMNNNFRDRSAPSIESVQLGIQLLNLAATANAAERDGDIAFNSFTLLSCKTTTMAEEFLKRERKNILDGHLRYLDPFVVENVECLDQFPVPALGSNDAVLAPDALSPFCFPNGLRVRLLPKCAVAGAEKLGWLGTSADRYQLHVFTDEGGNLSHGVAITTREVLSSTDMANVHLVGALSRCREKAVAARRITRFWHKYKDKKGKNLSTASNSQNFWEKKGKHWQGLFGKKGKVGTIQEEDELKSTSTSEVMIRLAKESFKEMNASAREDEVCIVEKSYILLGTKPEEQSLLFAGMQQLVDMERESNSKDKAQSSIIGQNRHMLLMLMQTKLCLSKEQSAFCLPESELLQIQQPKRIFELDLPFGSFEKISLPLPLPHISAQWGFATLLLRLGCSELLVLLKLLLLERSVVVLGTKMEEVTSCSCALLDLLKPYKWASTFMPLLPPSLIDFLSSPVPYITGMVAESGRHLGKLQNDYRVQEAIASDGLSVLNIDSGKLTTSDSDQVGERIRMFGMNTGIEFYASRLKELAANNNSFLPSFRLFFTHGPSIKERITLHSTREKIKRHLHSLAGDLFYHPDAWPEYLEYNEFSKAHEFTPAMFLEPLRKKMMHQLKYQEMMAHTQLFVGFVEDLKNQSEERLKLCEGDAAAFIVDFLNFKWPRYRNLHLS